MWDDLHPASRTRQIVSLQLSGNSDYVLSGSRRRGVTWGAPCRICFQPDKDVMIPGFPGIMDYPTDVPRPLFDLPGEWVSECERMRAYQPYLATGEPAARSRRPKVFFSGAVQVRLLDSDQ